MGLTVEGADRLVLFLQQAGPKAQKRAIDQMREEAIDIRDLARKMAPVDEGNLEKAIVVAEAGGGREANGQFARKQLVIGIDDNAPGSGGKEVGDYAYLMHEHLAPYGYFRLGPKSVMKQAGQSEMVGGKFLERAAAKISEGLVNRIIQKVVLDL